MAENPTTWTEPARACPTGDPRAGFSLVELMIAVTLGTLLMTGVTRVFISMMDMSYYTMGKLQVSRDIRTFTSEMSASAKGAALFEIYPSFDDRSETAADGSTGDYLVLYYRNHEGDIYKVVGYYRMIDDATANEGPVLKHSLVLDPAVSSMDDITLPTDSTAGNTIVELSRGLADGRLFYNYYGHSVMVRGEMIHSGRIGQRATNTYNFTVFPRG